jgi:putative Holliday junction resolvase
LGIDVGAAWIGFALSDPTGFLASPLCTLRRADAHGARLRALVEQYEVEALVIGLPLNMDGTSGGQVQETYAYVESLGPLHVPVSYWDERLSSWEAEQVLANVRGRSPRRRARRGDVVAAVMLQDFLDAQRRHAHASARTAI